MSTSWIYRATTSEDYDPRPSLTNSELSARYQPSLQRLCADGVWRKGAIRESSAQFKARLAHLGRDTVNSKLHAHGPPRPSFSPEARQGRAGCSVPESARHDANDPTWIWTRQGNVKDTFKVIGGPVYHR